MLETSIREIEDKLKGILSVQLAVSTAMLANTNASTPLLGRGIGLDSVETMALAMEIEKMFEICIPDSDLTAKLFATLGTVTEYVAQKLSEQHKRGPLLATGVEGL